MESYYVRMSDLITIPSALVAVRATQPMSPAMRVVLWQIAAWLDENRIKPSGHAVWAEIPTARLRGEGARNDNVHLRTALDRLTAIQLSGVKDGGDPWGAVLLAEYHIEQGGTLARLLVPPSAVAAIAAPDTFTKIETRAAHQLTGHARQLYAILADKKRLRQNHWTFELSELRALLNVDDKKAYLVWHQFNKRVLQPAVEQINDFGTVSVRMSTKKLGRSIAWVRFDWKWKDIHDASETAIQNSRHSTARRKKQENHDAPPIIKENDSPPLEEGGADIDPINWWRSLSDAERDKYTAEIGSTFEIEMPGQPGMQEVRRGERDLAEMALAIFKENG